MLEYEPSEAREIEPLMGWTSSGDMNQQVKLRFNTREEAVAYAEREGIPYRVEEPNEVSRRTMSYSDNFKFNRVGLLDALTPLLPAKAGIQVRLAWVPASPPRAGRLPKVFKPPN